MSPALSEMQEKALTGRLPNNHQDHEERQEKVTDEKSQNTEVQYTLSFEKGEMIGWNCEMLRLSICQLNHLDCYFTVISVWSMKGFLSLSPVL